MSQLDDINSKVIQWHKDRNLIDGATALSQSKKLLEEYTEVIASLLPDQTSFEIYSHIKNTLLSLHTEDRIKSVTKGDSTSAYKDALGDMGIVLINLMEREGWSLEECLGTSYKEIEHRNGIMLDGVFVKEQDAIKEYFVDKDGVDYCKNTFGRKVWWQVKPEDKWVTMSGEPTITLTLK